MTAELTVDNLGQACTVALSDVTGLDALVYRQTMGEDLDGRLGKIIAAALVAPDSLPLADRAVVVWLWTRHNVNPDATLPVVAASVHLMPSTPSVPDGAEGVVASEAG